MSVTYQLFAESAACRDVQLRPELGETGRHRKCAIFTEKATLWESSERRVLTCA